MDRAEPQCSNEGCTNDLVFDICIVGKPSSDGMNPKYNDWIQFLKNSSINEGDGKLFCAHCLSDLCKKFEAERTRNEPDSSGIQNEVPVQNPNHEDDSLSSLSSSTGTLVTVGSLESEDLAQSSTQNQDSWTYNNVEPLNLSEPDSSNDA